jgi:5'-nucleotidase/UDP-sugar diphosphatase
MSFRKKVLKWSWKEFAARLFAVIILVWPAFFWFSASASQAWAEKLVVLHTNDHHGHPVAFSFGGKPSAGGLPARATLVEKIRAENGNVLVLDAGDINTGRPESNLFDARPDIIGYNFIGYDAMAIGNHDFDHGKRALAEQMAMARFPFLSANIRTASGNLLARPYIIKSFNGFKVAVFGLTTVETTSITYPEHIAGLHLEDEVETAWKLVPRLRKQADVVIALVHLGIYATARRGSLRLAREVPGIDLVVDGHSHTKLDKPVRVKNRISGKVVPVVQAWKWGLMVGKVDMDVSGNGVFVTAFEALPVNFSSGKGGSPAVRIKENRDLLVSLEPFLRKTDEMLSEPITWVTAEIAHHKMRTRETPLGRLVAESMMWSARALRPDFAVQNSGGVRDDIPRGTLTAKTIHQVLPFDNTVVVVELDGKAMGRLLEHMAVGAARKGKGFPQVSSGLEMRLEAGSGRITQVLIGGKPLDPDSTYRVATNSYLAAGGDGYRILADGDYIQDTSICQREALIEYARHLGTRLSPPQVKPAIIVLR